MNNPGNYFIYRHIRPDKNEPFYIGIGKHNTKWKYKRLLSTKNRNIHWQRIVELNNGVFETNILMDDLSMESVIKKECEFIKLYGRSDLRLGTLCNMTDGGEGVLRLSQESRDKISKSMLGNTRGTLISKESLKKRVLNNTGKNNWCFGKKFTEEHKDKLRQNKLGKKQSAEHVKNRTYKLKKQVIDTVSCFIYSSIGDVAIAFNKSRSQISRDIKKNMYNLKFHKVENSK